MRKMDKKGFTLVELMVVLAILGLLAAVGVPQYRQVMERARIGRDLAAIATVQTAVNAFLGETGWDPEDSELEDLSNLEATSLITGKTVSFMSDFWDDNALPNLESSSFKDGAEWRINKNGNVYVKNGKYTLPEQPTEQPAEHPGGGN